MRGNDGTYSIRTDSANQCDQDTTLYLLDADGLELDFNDDDDLGNGLCSRIDHDLSPGTYTAEMQSYDLWVGGGGDCRSGDYTLTIEEL